MSSRPTTANEPSAELAAFVAGLSFEDVPADAVRVAERCFVDTVGVTMAGATTGAGATTAAALGNWGGGDAHLLGRGGTAPLLDAVFANATAGHGLDFDDFSWGMDGHPSVPMVAPILALGSATGASGEDAIAAYVAGFEAQCYLAAPITPKHYERGWHATATFGTFGATAAAANLLDLSESRTRHALNVAASMPAGLKRNFGSMTKPVHVGQAARSGVTAALLANEGVTADAAAVGGSRGFIDLYAGDAEPDFDSFPALGDRWSLLEEGIQVKKYPCCYFAHSSIAVASRLARERDLAAADVERVRVRVSRGAADALAHDDPDTGLEAKFSMPYAVGYALVNRTVDLAAFEDANLNDPAVRQVSELVTLETDPELAYDSTATTLTVETPDDGYRRSLERPPGTHDDPLSNEELHEKFAMCATRATDEASAERALSALDALRDQDRLSDSLEPLR